jgi:hypothetical protein
MSLILFKNEFTNFNFNTTTSFWTGEAEEIILPTETGEMGVLKKRTSYYRFRCWCDAYS